MFNNNFINLDEPVRKPSFTSQDCHPVFVDEEYEDSYGNIWSIVVRGEPQVVEAFLAGGGMEVAAEPLTEEVWQSLREQVYAHDMPPDDGPYEADELPSLEIYASLRERRFEGRFFHASYRANVPDAGSSVHWHTLNAGDNDNSAICNWQSQGKKITVAFGGRAKRGFHGPLSRPSAKNAKWSVKVTKDSGSSYWLWGDSISPNYG